MEDIKIYGYDSEGYFTEVQTTNKYKGLPKNFTYIAPTMLDTSKFFRFNGTQWEILDSRVISIEVPQTITVRQAREQLIRIGLLSKVQTEIDKITDLTQKEIVQNYWEYSMDFKRDNEVLITLATNLGLTSQDIDSLFIEASKL